MIHPKTLFLSAVFTQVIFTGPASADVLAATNFDGRALTTVNIADDTATALNWTLNGLEDPGNMTVVNASGGGLALFNGTPTTQDMFAPALNTGNGSSFWTTEVAITAAPGSTVTLTDVTFDYWAVSAGQVQNVNRRSDFTIALFSPSATAVGSVDIVDTTNGTNSTSGTGTAVTAAFASPIALTDPGIYTLKIKGGDFLGSDETGNHTAIDNLSINGEVGGMPETFQLIITSNATNPGHYDFRWGSRDGKLYDLVSSTDLSTAPVDWPVWQGHSDIDSAPPENTLTDVPGEGPTRFFAMIEKDAPPPAPLLSEDFESDNGGFTIAVPNQGSGTEWAWGTPSSPDRGGGAVTAGNHDSAQCWGTNLSGGYAADTDAILRSPVIDLTGVAAATLSFGRVIDAAAGHTLEVNVIDDTTEDPIATVIAPFEDPDLNTTPWKTISVPIPAAALGQPVRLEWRFTGDGGGDDSYNGAYIDEVVITVAGP